MGLGVKINRGIRSFSKSKISWNMHVELDISLFNFQPRAFDQGPLIKPWSEVGWGEEVGEALSEC